jgi:AmiR/NasT family two-component response regulator
VAIQILRDLRGLRVLVVHPPDNERVRLVEHLRRIGCMVETQWPVPETWSGSSAGNSDVMLLAVEHDVRADIQRLLKSTDGPRPTLIAVVGYEDPSTLQLVLEAGAVAVIERPIRPFGLLTNLTIARSIWLEKRETEKRIRKLERKLAGLQRIQKAKSILMDGQGLSEVEAYESIRRQAMAKRLSMDDMAAAIIHANELLQYRAKDV